MNFSASFSGKYLHFLTLNVSFKADFSSQVLFAARSYLTAVEFRTNTVRYVYTRISMSLGISTSSSIQFVIWALKAEV